MPSFVTDGLTLHYEQYGARADPTVLLIHGLTCQLVHWPPSLIRRLAATGYRVVAFDNRDVGLSGRLEHQDVGTSEDVLRNPRDIPAPYSLRDMARDAVALLDHLGQSGAHVVGLSMGGMIAQHMALQFPERVFSLTCIAASTSDRDLPGGDRAAFTAFASTPPRERSAGIAHRIAGWRAIGGPHFDSARVGLGRFEELAWDRGYCAAGAARQLLAILRAEPRGEALRQVRAPALVIHGGVDPMVPLAAGERTAGCLENSRLVVYENMGHDLPEPLLGDIGGQIVRHLEEVPVRR